MSTIRAAEATGNLEIRPNSRVMQILTNDTGQITGVRYLDADGNEMQLDAGLVILSTYVYENVRLLLLSTSDFFRTGSPTTMARLVCTTCRMPMSGGTDSFPTGD